MSRPKTPVAVRALSRDLLVRIRRAEWAQERKRAEVKDRTYTRQWPTGEYSWGRILKVMR